MKNQPFIMLYKTINGFYFYDVHRNTIVNVPKDTFEILEKISQGQEITDKEEGVLKKYKDNKLLDYKKTDSVENARTQDVENILYANITSVTLQMTQNCNLRCSYCIYSEKFIAQREHGQGNMKYEIACKAIDFLMAHSYREEVVDIGFYGGEPLLVFEQIKKIVKYIETNYAEKKVSYGMTTNATLLTPEVSDYLVEKKFNIMISLDGPKEIHDLHRRFNTTGKGSFDIIRSNIKYIKDTYPEFYERMTVSMVEDPQNDYDKIKEVKEDEILGELDIMSAVVDDSFSVEKAVPCEEYVSKSQYDIFVAYLSCLKNEEVDWISTSAKRHVEESCLKYENLKGGMYMERFAPSGACVPGQNKLFVSCEGVFYPCEKVSETSEAMKIGSVDTGFDLKKVKALMNIAKLDEDMCKNCWAIRNCDICCAYCDCGGRLSSVVRNIYCKDVKKSTVDDHLSAIMLQEAQDVYGYNPVRF